MATPGEIARGILLLAAAGGYMFLAHITTSSGAPSTVGALIAISPWLLGALVLSWRSRYRPLLLIACALAAAALWANRAMLASGFSWIYLLQHAGTFAVLAIVFGRSLATGATPTISRLAAMVHEGPLPALVIRYTRTVTQVWTMFFGVMSLSSLALFFSGQIAAWSLLVNVLTPPLIAAVFLLEYLVRRQCVPPDMRTGLVDSVRVAFKGAAEHRPEPRANP